MACLGKERANRWNRLRSRRFVGESGGVASVAEMNIPIESGARLFIVTLLVSHVSSCIDGPIIS